MHPFVLKGLKEISPALKGWAVCCQQFWSYSMLKGENLRRADFITSVLLILLGLWILYKSFQMPMQDSYGGVQNVWYVSPALFPLIIGIGILILGIVLCVQSVKLGGYQALMSYLRSYKMQISLTTVRFWAILLCLITYVYLYIPRVDFFLTTLLFMIVFISLFYLNELRVFSRLLGLYFVISLLYTALVVLGVNDWAVNQFAYSVDVFILLFIIVYVVIAKTMVWNDSEQSKKMNMALLLSFLIPLFLCPIFKYFLLVPLPNEGLVIGLMDTIRYSLF